MNMDSAQLSSMEKAVLAVFHELYRTHGFPVPDRVRVRRRENTGSGRYVDLDTEDDVQLDDGCVDLGGRFIEMSGVPNGLMAVAHIKNHRVQQIEIAVYGDDPWDGEEREWSII